MRSAIREEVASIEPFDALECAHREDALAWIDSGVELCRTEKPATPPKHLVSYFVLVDHDHLLLVDHKNAQLWLPSGGHVEPGEHPRITVARELREELGLDLSGAPEAPLMLTTAETVGTTAGHTDVSRQFPAAIPTWSGSWESWLYQAVQPDRARKRTLRVNGGVIRHDPVHLST